jgi:hypothetical protein
MNRPTTTVMIIPTGLKYRVSNENIIIAQHFCNEPTIDLGSFCVH